MTKIEAFCTIEAGKLHVIRRDKFVKSCASLKDGRYSLTIEKKYKKRSNPQNAYLFGVVYPIVLQGLIDLGFEGMTIESVHDLLKYKFLPTDIVSKEGEVMEIVRSTASLTTTEFMDYLAKIKKWGAEYLNVYVPEPNEQLKMEL